MKNTVNKQNFEQWSIVSTNYHDIRPTPPEVITKTILSWLNKAPDTLVDIGCGTGISTFIWQNVAANIIGIEPNDEMRAVAESNPNSGNIAFIKGLSNETGLPDSYADIITVAQAFHWMDIDSSLQEFHRILKPGGVLAIYDFALPPIISWEIEKAFLELRAKCSRIWYSQATPPVHGDKESYLQRIESFGKFRFARKAPCHGIERWPLQKAAAFLVHISNAEFAMTIDDDAKKSVSDFIDLVSANGKDAFEIVFPYSLVLAVK